MCIRDRIESQQVQSDPTITKEKYASDRFEQLKQVVLSNENLYEIADKYKLYGLDKKARPLADVAVAARKNINASLLKAEAEGWEGKPTFALEISYNYYKPEETYNVTNEIVKLFLEENDKAGKLRATETAEFYGKEAEKQRAALLKIESEVTKYKKMHANTLPENKEMHLESLDRLELDLRNVQREYSATQSELRSLDVSLESAKAGIGLALGPCLLYTSLLVVYLMAMTASIASAEVPQGYKLRHGDLIQVSVWGEEKLHKESLVLPDGSITYPLAGRVEVIGLTSTEAEKKIAEKLKAYLPDPQVSVVIEKIAGNLVHVLGKVVKPGQVLMNGPMTVLDALGVAGGLDKFADKGAIKVLRNTPQGQKLIPVHYEQLIRGERLESNVILNPGDTILVP